MNAASPALAQTGVLSLIANSGPVAIFVIFVLLLASMMSWAIIYAKWKALSRAAHENKKFLETFKSGKTLSDVDAKVGDYAFSPIAAIFRSGVTELNALSATKASGDSRALSSEGMINIQRALLRASSVQISEYERYIGWLATTASAAPFVGLFGTVWGIMNSFQSIGATGGANLAVVAPGISEALITTATGIAAAVPAVIAYNYFAGQIRKLAVELENFAQDFLNIVQRSLLNGSQNPSQK